MKCRFGMRFVERGRACTVPGAFITDDKDLYFVIGPGRGDSIIVEDCSTGGWSEVTAWKLRATPWYLVTEAPVEELEGVRLPA